MHILWIILEVIGGLAVLAGVAYLVLSGLLTTDQSNPFQ